MTCQRLSTSIKDRSPMRRHAGQAMVFTLAFGIATSLIALVLFNSGMLANAKGRLQNAVDAGAYSAGVLQARDHNFSAYTNRAMVANQVAVVQLASLKSYLEDAADTRDRMDGTILGFSAELHPSSTPLWDAAKSVGIDSVNSAFASLAPTAVTALDSLIHALEIAQEAHRVATVAGMALVADEVIRRNAPQAELTRGTFFTGRTTVQLDSWRESTVRHRANSESAISDRFADVVVSERSTDEFTRRRPSTLAARWDSTVKWCEILPNYVISFTTFSFTHGGGSFLSADKKRWLSLDATLGRGSYLCVTWYVCPLGGTCFHVDTGDIPDNTPIGGSGGAVVGRNGDYDDEDGYHNNPSSSDRYGDALIVPAIPAWVRYGSGPGSSLDTAGGLQDYYRDMANPSGSLPADQTAEENGANFGVTIEAERTGATLRTSSAILPGSQRLRLEEGLQGGTMRALAGSQSYFYRNRETSTLFTHGGWNRADARTEVSNLFSPYWQARLADRSLADRAASWAAQ